MADLKPEVIEPEPATISSPKDDAVMNGAGSKSGSAVVTEEKIEPKENEEKESSKTEDSNKQSENGHSNGDRSDRRRDGDRDGKFRDKRPYKNDSHNRGGFKQQYRKNNKFDPSALKVDDTPTAIRAQVEFYFGDSNFVKDKFMWELCDGAENKPVPLTTIHNFGRMRNYQPYSAIVEALKSSSFLDVEGEDGKETVKRKVAYDPNQPRNAKEPRSVYAKGFGEEKPTSQFDLEAFFAKFGTTNEVRLRRHTAGQDIGLFKGSVFVEFVDEETAKKFLALDPPAKWEGQDLKVMSKSDYMAEKVDLIKEGKMVPNETRPKFNGNHRDRDPNDWKKRREDDQKSGFRSDRKSYDNKGGRGQRGNHRGGNRGGNRGRGGRDRSDHRDRNDQDRNEENEVKKERAADPSTAEVAAEDSKKRGREADDTGAVDAPAEKKQDVKGDVVTES